jgi:hypothetical protein
MPRRTRPPEVTRSEHWLRVAANEAKSASARHIAELFGWQTEALEWVSPIAADAFAEYYDDAFLAKLGLTDLNYPLADFWPASGPRWDGLARTECGKVLLVEAKAHIEEAVDYRSAAGPTSMKLIQRSLDDAKQAYAASEQGCWESPFYQTANRLAHLHFLRELNGIDAYLLYLNFADAPDVPFPASTAQWEGAARITHKCLGLARNHPYRDYVGTLNWPVADMLASLEPDTAARVTAHCN